MISPVLPLPALTEMDFDNRSQLPYLSTLPVLYPHATPTAWRRFWKTSILHRVHILLWRLYHLKTPCKKRLHQLIPNLFPDPDCVYCGGVDSEEHFVWSCPFKHAIWKTIASHFFVDPARLTYTLIQRHISLAMNLPLHSL
ncbi:hypothetical protein G6F37_009544 [Rhizopus arrhizus]|nr:hypothetical protein G6F38_008929 [Rhizopus arrhizus]KAG1154335.1 hypothetical protein G6F37_009544 [Rhizopus arrhizus]